MKKGEGDVYYGMYLLMLYTFIIGAFTVSDKTFKIWEWGVVISFFIIYLIYTINAVRKL